MKRVIIAILILSAIWAAFFFAADAGLKVLANESRDGCFDNAGKWYTR